MVSTIMRTKMGYLKWMGLWGLINKLHKYTWRLLMKCFYYDMKVTVD